MSRLLKKTAIILFFAVIAPTVLLSLSSVTYAADNGVVSSQSKAQQTAAEVMNYWSVRGRMENAVPIPMPTAIVRGAQESAGITTGLPVGAKPGYAPGWNPRSGLPQPDPNTRIEITPDDPMYKIATGAAPMTTFGSPPANPLDYENYGRFSRWTWYGNYTVNQPIETIGKMFFTQNSVNYVCSGSVINKNTFATAGHCVSDGSSTWSTNIMFCPSYYKGSGSGAVNPARGCWAGTNAVTSTAWHTTANTNHDYACVVTATTGTIVHNNMGNVTGWTGRAWNFAASQHEFSIGYPAGSPFAGYHIIFTAATEWYSVDMGADGHPCKYIGSDQTGGCSGGPWWLHMEHRTAGYADTDGSEITNPGYDGTYINGVNSHKRCLNDCGTPTATSGVFWQEMGSPEFTDGDGSSEDIFSYCFTHSGS